VGANTNAKTLMKAPLVALLVVVLSLGLVAGAVFGLGDDEIFVQPPARVAEEFVRALATGQPGAARGMLTRDAGRRTTSHDMRDLSDAFRARIGRVNHVHGTIAERRRDTAMVRARIEGERMNAEPIVALVRESGEWSVARARDVLASDDSTQSQRRP
jgi:hypothetical protein